MEFKCHHDLVMLTQPICLISEPTHYTLPITTQHKKIVKDSQGCWQLAVQTKLISRLFKGHCIIERCGLNQPGQVWTLLMSTWSTAAGVYSRRIKNFSIKVICSTKIQFNLPAWQGQECSNWHSLVQGDLNLTACHSNITDTHICMSV